jgi:hypothetical protein
MTHKEFYVWLEGYLTGKLENKTIEITPIVEKMGEVMSDEQKWIDDFERYKKIKNPLNTIEIKNSQK